MYLLDTNVLSELRKIAGGRADPAVVRWQASVSADDLFISPVTLREIEQGILLLQRRDRKQGDVLSDWMRQQVLPEFAGRILSIDTQIAFRCAQLHVPDPRAESDAWIAATALVHGMTVVTRNVRDFASTGVRFFDPWQPQMI